MTPVAGTEQETLLEAAEVLDEVRPRRFPPYPKYKPSGIEWLGNVPEHWEVKRLKFCARINPVKSEVAALLPDTEVSFVPMEAVCEHGGIILEQTKRIEEVYQGYTFFRDGDVVIAKITPCFENGKGSIAFELTNGVAFGTTELHVVRPECEMDTRFFFYVSLSSVFRGPGEGEMYGAGGQKRVPDSFLQNYRISLPGLDEQQAIAAFLDRETGKIDTLVAKKRRLIELLKEKRTALISHAVTKGLNPDAPLEPSGIDWLGDVPAHWEFTKLGFMVAMCGGSTPSKSNDVYWRGDIPWVSPKDMKVREIVDSEDHLSELAVDETSLQLLEPPVVLMVVRGMILAHTFPVAITKVPVTINQDMKALTPGETCSPEYLLNLLNGITRAILGIVEESAHGTKVLRMPLWKHVGVFLPDVKEQQSICDHISEVNARFDRLTAKVDSVIERLLECRTALISAAVTGKIDVRKMVE